MKQTFKYAQKRFSWHFWISAFLLFHLTGSQAHPSNASAILLDIGINTVKAEVNLPLDQLSIAAPKLDLSFKDKPNMTQAMLLNRYLLSHIQFSGTQGMTWPLKITSLKKQDIDGVESLSATLTNSVPLMLKNFILTSDAISHRVKSHKTYVILRSNVYEPLSPHNVELDVLNANRTSLSILDSPPSKITALWQFFKIGMEHIASGVDHLIFLFCLLLPAFLKQSERRWLQERVSLWQGIKRITLIVSMFTLGHSASLLVSTLGWIPFPIRLIEVLVAASILFSALHAIRPLGHFRGIWIGLLFGLIHGMAFAETLSHFSFNLPTLLLSVLTFNLGIETMQLILVCLVTPVLWWLSRSRYYPSLKNNAALFSSLLACYWIFTRI